jgi:metallo-beta-lactamase class B
MADARAAIAAEEGGRARVRARARRAAKGGFAPGQPSRYIVASRMRPLTILVLLMISGSLTAVAQDDWNTPHEPFRIFGNTYYVGTAGLSAILITSKAGHILVDGGLPQSARLIMANIRTLGFEPRDVRLILNSHEHFDHAGGLGALQRATGARVAASPAAARALRQGHPAPDDPQYTSGLKVRFDAIRQVETIADRTTLQVGPLAITAHFTPGHTPGATTWAWRSCEGTRCVDIVYADSLTPVSDDGFKFTGDGTRPSRVDAFRASIDRVEQLPCDVILAPHPEFVDFARKVARLEAGATGNPFIESNACRTYAAAARKRLEQRIADERK